MEEFVPFDASKHLGEFRQLNIETTTWCFEQLRENYEIDAESIMEQIAQEYVDEHLDDLRAQVSRRLPISLLFCPFLVNL